MSLPWSMVVVIWPALTSFAAMGSRALQAVAEMKEKFKPTLMANYVLWPAANLINFAFVPPSQRILYVNVVYVSISIWLCKRCMHWVVLVSLCYQC
jgi:hypothetical protein